MKSELLQALENRRRAVLMTALAEGCHRKGYLSSTDPLCRVCPRENDCRWLGDQNDFIALANRPVAELADLLRRAIDQLDSNRHTLHHNAVACCCTPCEWRRRARRLLKQVGRSAPTDIARAG